MLKQHVERYEHKKEVTALQENSITPFPNTQKHSHKPPLTHYQRGSAVLVIKKCAPKRLRLWQTQQEEHTQHPLKHGHPNRPPQANTMQKPLHLASTALIQIAPRFNM